MSMRLVTLFACLLLTPFVAAETRYISDELRVPLRSSPCNRCAIIHSGLVSGTELTVLETNDEGWSHVTTDRGTEGWLPERYLVKQQVAQVRIRTIAEESQKLRNRHDELNRQYDQLKQDQEQLLGKLSSLEEENLRQQDELTAIKQVSGNALNLHQENEELLKQNRILQNEIDVLTARTEQLSNDNSRTMFIYGALAVVGGMLLAVILPNIKRRKRYSEWG